MKPQDFANLQKKLNQLLTEDEQLDELSPEVYKSAADKRFQQSKDLLSVWNQISLNLQDLAKKLGHDHPAVQNLRSTVTKYRNASMKADSKGSSLSRHAEVQDLKKKITPSMPSSIDPKGSLGRMLK